MALTTTTLASAMSASAQSFNATSASGASVGGYARIENELMVITAISGTIISIRSRGAEGTAVAAHAQSVGVTFGLTADFPAGAPFGVPILSTSPDVVSYAADGAITPPTRTTTAIITKATAAALTLAGPSALSDGVTLTILSATAAAHTVTYTAGFYGDTVSSDVGTYAAKAGASMTVIARGGTWGVQSLANVTLA